MGRRSESLDDKEGTSDARTTSNYSRVGGTHHGIVTTLERGNEVLALSKGAGRILRMDLEAIRITGGVA